MKTKCTKNNKQRGFMDPISLGFIGALVGHEEYHKVLDPIFAEWPQHLRPIP